jgi:hypothetical protein
VDVGTLRHAELTSTSEPKSSDLVTLSASLKTAYSPVLQALINSGATLNFINEWIVNQLKLKTEPCASTRVTFANGRPVTHSARQVTLEYTVAAVAQRNIFLIAPIGDHSLILGIPWLERVNPRINWRTKSVDTNDFFHSSTSSTPSVPEVPDLTEAEEPPLVSSIESSHEHEDSYAHISSNLESMESKESKESNFCSSPANLQRIASLCGVADPKDVAKPQNPSITIEVPALPVKLRSICSQPAVKL